MKKVMVTGIFMLCSLGIFAQGKTVNLPKVAQDFITGNFSSLTVQEVKENSNWKIWEDDKYEVILSNGIEIDFDENGNVLEIESKNNEPIPFAAIPSQITAYLGSNYPNAAIIGWEKDSKGQEIELSDGTELEFDKDGNFIRID